MRERELKPPINMGIFGTAEVAPHAGARIETLFCGANVLTQCVAPHAGARIETRKLPTFFAGNYRRSPCGSAN